MTITEASASLVSPTEISTAWRFWYPQAASPSAAVAMLVDDRHSDAVAALNAEVERLRERLLRQGECVKCIYGECPDYDWPDSDAPMGVQPVGHASNTNDEGLAT